MSARIQSDIQQGQSAGVSGTPSFVLGGQILTGAQPFAALKAQVDQALARKPQGAGLAMAGAGG